MDIMNIAKFILNRRRPSLERNEKIKVPCVAGWIRGVAENEKSERRSLKYCKELEMYILERTKVNVLIYPYLGGAAIIFSTDFHSEMGCYGKISLAVAEFSKKLHFYQTCSFEICYSLGDIPHTIRIARSRINTHQEFSGVFFKSGKMFILRDWLGK